MPTLHRLVRSAAVALAISPLCTTHAFATPGSGFIPNPFVNGHFGKISIQPNGNKTDKWGLIMKTLDDTDIGADRLAIQPGGYSGWHAHPGPVFITVTQGSVVFYDGADPLCPSRTYGTGESFIESAYDVHFVKNASASAAAEYIAVTIKPEGFVGLAFRLDRPEPNNCTF